MDFKWIDRMYQFESEPSGGGEPAKPAEGEGGKEPTGEGVPAEGGEPAVSDEGSGDVDSLETRGDDGPIDDDEGGEKPKPTETPAVGVPEDLGAIFKPSEPVSPPAAAPAAPVAAPVYEPRPTATAEAKVEAPQKVDFPDADDWLNDAGKAATQQAAAIAYSNWESQGPMRQAIEQIQGRLQGEDRVSFEQTRRAVDNAVQEAQGSIDKFYAQDGPLNSDAEFRNNPDLQKAVENVIGQCVERGIWIAEEHGNTAPLDRITKDPKFIRRTLALAKADVITPDAGLVPGASPVVQQPPKTTTGDGLTADQRKALKAARAEGSTITAAEMRKATKQTQENIW